MAAFFVACSDDDSSFATRPSDWSSSSVCDDCDDGSSSSVTPKSNDSETSVSSSSTKSSSSSAESSSSSVIPGSSGDLLSSSSAKSSSSSAESSSSSVIPGSSGDLLSSSSAKSSSSSAESSSSVTLATRCKTESKDNCEYGELVDERDGQAYKTVKIGDQWWMAENLNYDTASGYCYNDSAEYCAKYGRLYDWATVMDSAGIWSTNGKGCGYDKTCSPTYPVRGICPSGWHLPSKTEWETLFIAVGGSSVAGWVLKSTSGWNNSGNGSDAFGFSALPAGRRYDEGNYAIEGEGARIWSSTEQNNGGSVYDLCLYDDSNKAFLLNGDKEGGFSVRCIKD
ncbi:fibrobacter succinogenes major paralogous domain-containing protein [Fibrobacter sp.]|uniref:fibrobacter succinogenes major paralogous domain-containing protein n=1 Tax=Fibrobacter sp. TaxID=35828 RepID=UPI0025BE5605|nr:fibrobacter succinogenes major paralogous domain-containing protein [Fibrobacter sp.]